MTDKKDKDEVIKAAFEAGDRIQHMTINGGIENGGAEFSYQKDENGGGWHVTRDENGEPVWTRVKWFLGGTVVARDDD